MNETQRIEKITEVSKTIFSYCMAKTKTRADAEDLSQDILCELIKSLNSIRDDRAFYSFMWAVAGNVYKQWCRKKAKSSTVELIDDISEEIDYEFGFESVIYILRRELTLLSEKYRRATILYYIDGKSCSEIASVLDISESMVKYLLFKSRKILKEGMNMDRKLGALSYNPKNFIPFYNGSGPNRFYDFMQSKIRQNIITACYNDSLTAEQISLETGIPLPYLDAEIKQLEDKALLIKSGTHYKANIIVITSACVDEINRNAIIYHNKIADIIGEFIETKLTEFRKIGFSGNDFTENSLRWQLIAFVLSVIISYDTKEVLEYPETAWGDHAYLWLIEEDKSVNNHIFNFSTQYSRHGDRICFFDYLPNPKGDHRDFYGNARYINILCDIVHDNCCNFSEYDLEAVAEMIRKGYVIKENNIFRVAMPVFTAEQYSEAFDLARDFVDKNLQNVIASLDSAYERILSEHTPKHLQKQAADIARMDRLVNAADVPINILVERKILNTDWNKLEMPTTFIVINS